VGSIRLCGCCPDAAWVAAPGKPKCAAHVSHSTAPLHPLTPSPRHHCQLVLAQAVPLSSCRHLSPYQQLLLAAHTTYKQQKDKNSRVWFTHI
jgi:hypothetical protein